MFRGNRTKEYAILMPQPKPRKPLNSRQSTARNHSSNFRPAKHSRQLRRRQRRPLRAIGALALIAFALLSVYAGYVYRNSQSLRTYLPRILAHGLRPQAPTDVFQGQQAINLLVIGRDNDYNNQDQVLKTRGRSDMLMVAHLDFAKHDVSLLSIPRDTRALIPGHGYTKINAAHKYGGPLLTAETIQNDFGIPTNKYVALDFGGFEKAIDLLGGVDLAVDKKMDYDDDWGHLHIHLKPGFQHLTGEEAMGFVRFRHSDSDLVRVQRQQTLLAALKAKLRQPQTLAKMPQLLDLLDSHVDSDLTTDQKIVLARFIHDTPRADITMATLPSSEGNGPYVETNWSTATPMIETIFHVTPPLSSAADESTGRRHSRHRRYQRLADAQ